MVIELVHGRRAKPGLRSLSGSDVGSLQDARLARGSEGRGAAQVKGPET